MNLEPDWPLTADSGGIRAICFAAPSKPISMNDRGHWAIKSREVKLWRTAARTAGAGLGAFPPAHVSLLVQSGITDPANATATMKAVIDGVTRDRRNPIDTDYWWADDDTRTVATIEPVILRPDGPLAAVPPRCALIAVDRSRHGMDVLAEVARRTSAMLTRRRIVLIGASKADAVRVLDRPAERARIEPVSMSSEFSPVGLAVVLVSAAAVQRHNQVLVDRLATLVGREPSTVERDLSLSAKRGTGLKLSLRSIAEAMQAELDAACAEWATLRAAA